jgi:hypothetical protein
MHRVIGQEHLEILEILDKQWFHWILPEISNERLHLRVLFAGIVQEVINDLFLLDAECPNSEAQIWTF